MKSISDFQVGYIIIRTYQNEEIVRLYVFIHE